MRRTLAVAALATALVVPGCAAKDSAKDRAIVVGAVYPTGGSQALGGREEFEGVRLAAELVNAAGGIAGRPIRLRLERADQAEQAPLAVDRAVAAGARIVVGSNGSTISGPAARQASNRGVVFWETGAVGMLDAGAAAGRLVFRFPPTGETLGREGVRFVREKLLPLLNERRGLSYTVVYVDDVYGRAVAAGAFEQIGEGDETLAARIAYDPRTVDIPELARRIARARTDVLVVAAYLDDGIALRRALVAQKVKLVANIGTSSSYCMQEFGDALGVEGVGLFASDKPDGDILDASRLSPDAAAILDRARALERQRTGTPMSAATLSGFSAAWALFRHVLPRAAAFDAASIAHAARATALPAGSLPNGAGLSFAPPDAVDAGSNRLATNVIWEWVRPRVRAIVWPPAFATSTIVPLRPR